MPAASNRHRRSPRPVAIALATSALYAGIFVSPAKAEKHLVRVTLVTGQQLTVAVDVEPGRPVDQAQIPNLPAPAASIVDLGVAESTPTPEPRERKKDKPKAERESKRRRANTESRSGTVSKPTPTPTPVDTPAPLEPSYLPGAPTVDVPDTLIDQFRIPPFLLPIYEAAGTQYGVRWEILAAINEIETDYGRNLNVSSAGALGWMQFMPATWKSYGVDANRDGRKDPYNPVDAIFAAARYLKAAGAEQDIRAAVFAYNHADWYVDSVLERAQRIGGLPLSLVGSLAGLTEGRFPVAGRAKYREAASAQGILIYAGAGSAVVAVNDVRVKKIGISDRLGRFVQVRDVYGNTYTYGRLAKISRLYAAPMPKKLERAQRRRRSKRLKQRLFANPGRKHAMAAGGAEQELLRTGRIEGSLAPARVLGLDRDEILIKKLRVGSRVPAGTVLGRIGTASSRKRPFVRFEIRPAGRGAPRIDPKPLLDGWKLLESTAIYGVKRKPQLAAHRAAGRILSMNQETLMRRVLTDSRIQIYGCGRRDIETGQIDRRVLATLEFLAASGLNPTVTSLRCGHSYLTASGNVSHHTTGTAVDIAAINGIPILGHQGQGSITDAVIQRLLTLQGAMKPAQIISLMTFAGADNTLAMADHADHIHVGFRPQAGPDAQPVAGVDAQLDPSQWRRLIRRLAKIDNPTVRVRRSKHRAG